MAAIGQMAAGIAHEIRNPLFGISSTAQILAKECCAQENLRELSEAMLSEINRLKKLVDDLLLYARPRRVERAPTNPRKIFEALVDLQSSLIASKHLKLSSRFEPFDETVNVDGVQIRQVLLNLLLNALQAAPDGGQATTHSVIDPSGWTFTITNDGPPIPSANLARVFEPFFSTKRDGSGLGLSVCRRIIEEHDGSIGCESSPSIGTRFTFRIPPEAALTSPPNPV